MDSQVTVYLNDCPTHAFRTYDPACCQLKEAVTYPIVNLGRLGHAFMLDEAFQAFNVGTDADSVVARYRAAGNRSLSVGDVVQIGEYKFRCDRIGWTDVTDG